MTIEAEIGQIFEEESESGFPKNPREGSPTRLVGPYKPTLISAVASNLLNFIV